MTRNFCSSCKRLRLNAKGGLYTCLHDEVAAPLGDMLRQGAGEAEIRAALYAAIDRKQPVAAQRQRGYMSAIGG